MMIDARIVKLGLVVLRGLDELSARSQKADLPNFWQMNVPEIHRLTEDLIGRASIIPDGFCLSQAMQGHPRNKEFQTR
jgi:hypothetical protein